jgi:hypothetical protein
VNGTLNVNETIKLANDFVAALSTNPRSEAPASERTAPKAPALQIAVEA